MPRSRLPRPVERDYRKEIAETFHRIRRPLQWPMESFRRRRANRMGFVGYTFSRVDGAAAAGFAFGFALRLGEFTGVTEPPEAVAYAFVRPADSALYGRLVTRKQGAVRKLVEAGKGLGFPFEWHEGEEIPAIRHRTLARVPSEIFVLAASDFFMIAQGPMRAGGFLDRVRRATRRPG
jgi:hypothetical protein